MTRERAGEGQRFRERAARSARASQRLQGARGLTLLECVIVVLLLAIALLAASPSIESARRRVSVDITARALLASMQAARAEALGRHQRVAMAPNDGRTLSSGWMTFVDSNRNDRLDAGERLLGRYAPLPQGVQIEARWGLYGTPGLAFAEDGFIRTEHRNWVSGTVRVTGHGRRICITINAYGRPRIARRCDP
ncbi:type II transport protein [Pandoraea nosoerga]|uniref:Type II secretion system protein H n=1 Tax=Pandoraea nosoerga TaxID=2508296 RepID=A0A5E4XD09_9BURK|nr:GspH/FimT family protein [Pandoraea nosoerga]MBN4666110.1 type II transport protein [Pandoraea nosoerga]MBN4676987.1 type II transport protein [Pandoraea nosoerga]MBN4681656.1 type II transport protein [Pandoraea nosoerga]MBN4745196.1 type II transport protein [Pandoraea nosoerga]VVE34095.1 FimT type IV pilus assembly protein [Pandoraea nosoerga]